MQKKIDFECQLESYTLVSFGNLGSLDFCSKERTAVDDGRTASYE